MLQHFSQKVLSQKQRSSKRSLSFSARTQNIKNALHCCTTKHLVWRCVKRHKENQDHLHTFPSLPNMQMCENFPQRHKLSKTKFKSVLNIEKMISWAKIHGKKLRHKILSYFTNWSITVDYQNCQSDRLVRSTRKNFKSITKFLCKYLMK